MLGKLLSLLLHAKAGAISGVFLLGATGALVSVSALNGVTTITITQPSASPSASASARVSTKTAEPSESPEPSKSPEPSESPEVKVAVTPACTDEAKALELQVQRVDTAFKGFHTDLMKLRGTRAADVFARSDAMLKAIRQAGLKAIDATATAACKAQDENDTNDENDTEDNAQAGSTTAQNTDSETEDNNQDESKAGTTPVTFTGTDAASIADQAIAQMQTAIDAAKNAPVVASTPKPTEKHDTQKKGNDQGGKHD